MKRRLSPRFCSWLAGRQVRYLLIALAIVTTICGRPRVMHGAGKSGGPAKTPQRDVFGAERPPLTIDEQKLLGGGLNKIEGQHLTVYTDCPMTLEIAALARVFDAAYPQWCDFFGVQPGVRSWRMRGFLMRERERFRRLGVLPDWLPPFENGYSVGDILWCTDQASEYYRRHLILHEGTHGFLRAHFGEFVSPWYNEGIAELLGTHRWDGKQLVLGYIPRSREECPLWGRVKIIRDAVAAGQVLSLDQVLAFGPTAHREVEPYGWCWAAAALFEHDPRFRDTFRKSFRLVGEGPFNAQFVAQFAGQWLTAQWQWIILLSNLDYGYDFPREAADFQRGQAILTRGQRVRILADRGWQNSGCWVEAGQAYDVAAEGRFVVAQDEVPWESEPQGVTIRYIQGRPLGMLLAAVVPQGVPDPRQELNAEGGFFRAYAVGSQCVLKPARSGTLFFRINDAPAELADNRGNLLVTIKPAGSPP